MYIMYDLFVFLALYSTITIEKAGGEGKIVSGTLVVGRGNMG